MPRSSLINLLKFYYGRVGYLKVCMLKTLFMSLTFVFNHLSLAFDCFFQDVILARVLDEATAASLNFIIHSNNAIVISILKDDSTFIQELFTRLRPPTTSAESKKNLVSQLPNKKETVYGALDKWVAWETESIDRNCKSFTNFQEEEPMVACYSSIFSLLVFLLCIFQLLKYIH
ncbi:uncharacterized protein [Gossypium hirsutum]|uniref:Uncharacterized protein isoform X2 n=1 Tax=Gossypium hirsutum TaxID=3635 RepID=A0ABM2Z8M6_GOSHI|nr:uncharacterized protein LOC107934727 isoform X2 [Gossypium hirsutum]